MIILGFWIVIGGLLGFPYPFLFRLALGSILVILGFVFIWMLKRGASQERMEKHLKEINDTNKERSLRQITNNDTANKCSRCNTVNGFDNVYCSKCGNKL